MSKAFTCYYSASDVLQYCDPEQYLYTIEQTFCSNNGGGGGGGGVETPQCPPSPGPGPGNPNPPTNPPTNPPPTVESINGKKMIRLVQGGDPGGGNCTVSNKEADLEVEIEADPAFLLKCEIAEKFKSLVAQRPPQSVYNRIDNLNDASPTKPLFTNPYFVQQIKNAYGPQINLDRFEVNVSVLPTVNGSQLTAAEFLNYIRLNISTTFIDNSITSFQPYSDPTLSVNDANLWNSSNPIGAILHLEIAADNGSVIVQESTPDHWTVATLRTPVDGAHPVSGNRSWGYTTNANGTYTFYVTGADRLTTARQELAQYLFGIPFNNADRLWQSFQSKVSTFVNARNGTASVGATIKERPDYALLADYFNGKITLAQLKAARGCN